MDSFESDYYFVNKLVFSTIGLWPYPDIKFKLLRRFLVFILFTTAAFVEILQIARGENINLIMQAIAAITLLMDSSVVYCNYCFRSVQARNILENIQDDWKSLKLEEEVQIMQKYGKEAKVYTLTYAIYVWMALLVALFWSTLPDILNIINPLNESRLRQLPLPGEYYLNGDRYFYLMLTHLGIGALIATSIQVGSDSMFILCVQHACGKFKLVGYCLDQALHKRQMYFKESVKLHKDKLCYRDLILVVSHHEDAVTFAASVESFFSWIFFAHIGLAFIYITITLTNAILFQGSDNELIITIGWTIGQLIQMFVLCFPGQKLLDHSQQVSSAAFRTKTLYAVILQTQLLLNVVPVSENVNHVYQWQT